MKFDAILRWGLLLACAGLLLASPRKVPPLSFSPDAVVAQSTARPQELHGFVEQTSGTASVHAGTITKLADGELLSAWFGGTREGARDVGIYMARLHPGADQWSPPTCIATREQTARDLGRYIRKLGNPVLFADSRDRVWLFYVTVSAGGWSGSSVTFRTSDDEGATWSSARRLVTSPFLNISTLVKAKPLETADGRIVLPVYHEFLRKFGEALVIDRDGHLSAKHRLTAEQGAIQPCLVVRDQSVRAFFRQCGHLEKRVLTADASQWEDSAGSCLECTNLANPDSAVAVVRRGDGYLMACNPLEKGRHRLVLATSQDGVTWRIVREIEADQPKSEFSYPYLISDGQGGYHLVYTWNRRKMRYVAFNDAWLEVVR